MKQLFIIRRNFSCLKLISTVLLFSLIIDMSIFIYKNVNMYIFLDFMLVLIILLWICKLSKDDEILNLKLKIWDNFIMNQHDINYKEKYVNDIVDK